MPGGKGVTSSMQPMPTSRSPCSGSRPVVWVSNTISRITSPTPASGLSHRRGESLLSRHFSDRVENVVHLGPGVIEALRAIHDKIRAGALFRLRHLLAYECGEFLFGHARPRHGARS